MTFSRTATLATLLLCASGIPLLAQNPADLNGSWRLNRNLSQFPQEIGFAASFIPVVPDTGGGGSGGSGSGGGGRRRGGSRGGGPGNRDPGRAPALPRQPVTAEESARSRFLTDEVRLPPDELTIVVTPAAVTLTPDRGAPRTVRPGEHDETLTFGSITTVANARWEDGRLVIA